jgi:hypothetical protein
MPKNKQVTFSEFYCTQCGERGIDIPRRKGAERRAGHLKKLYCLNCKKETNFCECKPFSKYTRHEFLEEYYGKNFTKEGLREKEYGIFKDSLIRKNKWNDLEELVEAIENDDIIIMLNNKFEIGE